MPEHVRYYKWLAADGPVFGTGEYAKPGEWQSRIETDLIPCIRGYHVLTAEQVVGFCGDGLIEVEIEWPPVIVQADKCLCRTWREVRRLKWGQADMAQYADRCVRRAENLVHTPYALWWAPVSAHRVARPFPRAVLGLMIRDRAPDNFIARVACEAIWSAQEALGAIFAASVDYVVVAERLHKLHARMAAEMGLWRQWIEDRIGEKL